MNKHKPDTKLFISLNIILAGCAVLLGAFAAHGLNGSLSTKALTIFQTSIRYMMWHSMSGICFAIYAEMASLRSLWPGWVFLLGVFLFSGSLFILSLTNMSWIGILTPLGGICFVVGWGGFLLSVLKR